MVGTGTDTEPTANKYRYGLTLSGSEELAASMGCYAEILHACPYRSGAQGEQSQSDCV